MTRAPLPTAPISVGPITLDPNARTVTVGLGEPARLTPMHVAILYELMRKPGRVFSAESLVLLTHGDDPQVFGDVVSVHICNIRKALRQAGAPDAIETKWGDGWSFTPHDPCVTRSFTAKQWAAIERAVEAESARVGLI